MGKTGLKTACLRGAVDKFSHQDTQVTEIQ